MEIDPYYILGVTRNDSLDVITRAYRLNAKKYHPDKTKEEGREYASRQFKILKDAYNTIVESINKGKDVGTRESYKKHYRETEQSREQSKEQSKVSTSSLESFNKSFRDNRRGRPNDFGYDISERLGKGSIDMDPSKVNWTERMGEYKNFDYKPMEVMKKDNFNNTEFNRLFEYTMNECPKDSSSRGLVTETRDGFMAANSGMDTQEYASISSWNGLMVVGDNFGESGVGYDTTKFGDYKHSFNGGRNPSSKLDAEAYEYKTKMETSGLSNEVLSKNEYSRLLNERESVTSILNNVKYDKGYTQYCTELDKKENDSYMNKLKDDTKFIEQYLDLYPKETVERAMKGQLESSSMKMME